MASRYDPYSPPYVGKSTQFGLRKPRKVQLLPCICAQVAHSGSFDIGYLTNKRLFLLSAARIYQLLGVRTNTKIVSECVTVICM